MILLEDTKQVGFFLTFIEKAIHGIFQQTLWFRKERLHSSADCMPEDKFWQLIAASRDASGGDPEGQESALAALLHELPLNDLITFQNRYRQLRGQAYTWPLWGAVYIMEE